MRASRRALLAGAGSLATASGLEAASLSGAFDHRARPGNAGRAGALRAFAERADGVVHIGHSTHVIELDGVRLLTDPWFADPAFGALAHAAGPACDVEDLPSLEAVLVSHEHPDHADLGALDRLADKARVKVLVATDELRQRLRARGFSDVTRLAPWDRVDLGPICVHAVPAVHDVPELGFVVQGSRARVYFAGDTGFQPGFAEIRERVAPTFALLPVDGTRLTGSSRPTLDALGAAHAAALLGVGAVMPSHAEARFTDPLAEHVLTRTSAAAGPERFAAELERTLPHVRCRLPQPGERVAV